MPIVNSVITKSSSGSSLPPQSGHAGEFLTTNGVSASWASVGGGGLGPKPENVYSIGACWGFSAETGGACPGMFGTVSAVPQEGDILYAYDQDQEDPKTFYPVPGISFNMFPDENNSPKVSFIGWLKVSRFDADSGLLYIKTDNVGEIPYLVGGEI